LFSEKLSEPGPSTPRTIKIMITTVAITYTADYDVVTFCL